MAGLIGDLIGINPVPTGEESAAATTADSITATSLRGLPLPTGTPSEASPSALPTANPDRADQGQDQGQDDIVRQPSGTGTDNSTQQEPSATSPEPQPVSTTPTRQRPTFVITDSPSPDPTADASSALPPPISPSAVPSLPSTPDPDEVLIVAPPPSTTLLAPTTLLIMPSSSLIPTPSGTALPSGDAEASLSAPGTDGVSGDPMASLMPALPISLGVGGGLLFFGVFAGLLYKKGVWPFRGDRQRDAGFEEIEDGAAAAGEAEKRFQRKWDPRVSGVGVFTSRTTNGATNF